MQAMRRMFSPRERGLKDRQLQLAGLLKGFPA